jgi:uncharacterized protein YjbI with pentapeptide repeats
MRLWKDSSGSTPASPAVMPTGGGTPATPATPPAESPTRGNHAPAANGGIDPFALPAAVSADPFGTGVGNGTASREERDEARHERRLLEVEFADALNRLADFQNPYMRAGGAARVAALATRRVANPGQERASVLEACPFFVRASAHITAAVHMEDEPAVRDEIRKALDSMVDCAVSFSADIATPFTDDPQLLVYALLDDLADANRSAKRAFQIVLARYLSRVCTAGEVNFEALRPLVGFTAFCADEELTFRVLCDLANEPECRTAFQVQATLGFAQSMRKTAVTGGNRSEDTFESLWHHSERLKESASALASCLRGLTPPPKSALGSDVVLENWRRQGRRVNLWGAFLPGARLGRVQLAGTTLAQANLHGAVLENAVLVGADLSSARLNGANLQGVLLHYDGEAGTIRADLHKANWWNADPQTWRGAQGEALQQHLQSRFPRPAQTAPPPAPAPAPVVAEALPTTPGPKPAAAAPAAGRSARSLLRGKAATSPNVLDSAGDLTVRESGLPKDTDTVADADLARVADLMDADARSAVSIDTVGLDTVQVRESGLPKTQHVSASDLTGVRDLMADRAPVTFSGGSVQIRDSGNPQNTGKVTDADLAGIQDLMKDR